MVSQKVEAQGEVASSLLPCYDAKRKFTEELGVRLSERVIR